MKKRLLFDEISPKIEHKNAILVTGMRQVGKTTLMRQLFDAMDTHIKKLWFDFDNPLEMKIFEQENYQAIFSRLYTLAGAKQSERLYIWIDEIQNYPVITKIVKYGIDHYHIKWFLTGSSQFYLKNLFPESLTGRKFLYELHPFTFREFLYFHHALDRDTAKIVDMTFPLTPIDEVEHSLQNELYEEYIRFGGFPEVALTPDVGLKDEVLKNIVVSFFEKDIQFLSDYTHVRELRDVLLLLIPRIGSTLDVTRLASELSVSRVKVYEYLNFLQSVFVLTLLPRFSKSIDKTVAGGRKVYFNDTGLVRALGNPTDGQLFENTVINQLRAYGDVRFYRKGSRGKEIDAILEHTVACEIKVTATSADVGTVKRLATSLNIAHAMVVSKTYVTHDGVVFGTQL